MPTTRKSSTRKPAARAVVKYPTGRYHVLHVAAPNTPSGNPRRLFLCTHCKTGKVIAFDEGYVGYNAIPKAIQRDIIGPYRIEVSASEYKALLRDYRE